MNFKLRILPKGEWDAPPIHSNIFWHREFFMTQCTIQEAQLQLADLIHQMSPGDELVITENDLPVARLVVTIAAPPKRPRQLGTLNGTVLSMAADFDAPLSDFKEYME